MRRGYISISYRYFFATALLARNKSPKVVQDLLGHSSITVTLDLYTASLDDLGREAVDSLDETFSRESKFSV